MTRTVVLTVTSPIYSSYPDEEWAQHCDVLETMQRELVDDEIGYNLAFSDAGGPNAKQRKQVAQVAAIRPQDAAMVSSSTFVRGVVTAVSWLGVRVKAFSPNEWRNAFARVGITSPDEVNRIGSLVLECERELDVRLDSIAAIRDELVGG